MSFKSNGLIVIGENFNATRKIKATSPRVLEENDKWGIKYTDLDGTERILDVTGRPIFYVLGNHDYYFGSVADVRRRAASIDIPGLKWLPETGIVELDRDTALIGHGGWGDAHRGDMENFIILTDYAAISDLINNLKSCGSLVLPMSHHYNKLS